jgi:hypothetical protein
LTLFSLNFQTFFREKADPDATTVASVSDTSTLVKKVLRMPQLPPLEHVSENVLKNTVAIEYLDLMAHTPWSTPLELVLSSDHVLAEAMAISALALFGCVVDFYIYICVCVYIHIYH